MLKQIAIQVSYKHFRGVVGDPEFGKTCLYNYLNAPLSEEHAVTCTITVRTRVRSDLNYTQY